MGVNAQLARIIASLLLGDRVRGSLLLERRQVDMEIVPPLGASSNETVPPSR
jgi:hypothetical protein